MTKRIVVCGRNEWDGGYQVNAENCIVVPTKRGHYAATLSPYCPSFVPRLSGKLRRFVFNSEGVCVSHPPKKNGKVYAYALDLPSPT